MEHAKQGVGSFAKTTQYDLIPEPLAVRVDNRPVEVKVGERFELEGELFVKFIFPVFAALAFVVSAAPAAAQPCVASEGREARLISGEISGAHIYSEAFGPGWFFELTPETGGWRIRILDGAGLDLAQMTPPLRGPNPRELYGWHFRNAANDGANQGDVNAPQELRLFGFDPRLSGTAGVKQAPGAMGIDDQPGRGALHVRDYGLADLDPGEKARMVYLKFDACLNWPSEYGAAPDPFEMAEAVVTPELEEQIRGCGLDASFEISPYLNPAELGGDFDGDGSLDIAVPVLRKSDGKRAIAMCRAGTWLDVLGLSGGIGEHLGADYFESIDWWALTESHSINPPDGRSIQVPDGVTIGKEGASSVLIYWDGQGWTSQWRGD